MLKFLIDKAILEASIHGFGVPQPHWVDNIRSDGQVVDLVTHREHFL